MREYEAYRRAQRRRNIGWAVLAWIILLGSALLMAFIGYAALLGFLVILGGLVK